MFFFFHISRTHFYHAVSIYSQINNESLSLLLQVKDYLMILSDGNVEQEMKSRIGAASALMRASYQAIGVKRELSTGKASN